MFNASITQHAVKRMQQRGIPERVLPLLFEYGEEEYDHHWYDDVVFQQASTPALGESSASR